MPHLNFISFITEQPCILPSSEIIIIKQELSTCTSHQRDISNLNVSNELVERKKIHIVVKLPSRNPFLFKSYGERTRRTKDIIW